MSSASARRSILFLMFVATAATMLKELTDRDSELFQPRVVIGGLVATFMLLAISERAPKLASGMATVVFITALVSAGPDTIGKLNPAGISKKYTPNAVPKGGGGRSSGTF